MTLNIIIKIYDKVNSLKVGLSYEFLGIVMPLKLDLLLIFLTTRLIILPTSIS